MKCFRSLCWWDYGSFDPKTEKKAESEVKLAAEEVEKNKQKESRIKSILHKVE